MGVPTARCGNVSTDEKEKKTHLSIGSPKAALLAAYCQRNLKLPTLNWLKGVKGFAHSRHIPGKIERDGLFSARNLVGVSLSVFVCPFTPARAEPNNL